MLHPDGFAYGYTIHIGQHNVENDEVEIFIPDHFNNRRAIVDRSDFVAFELKIQP
jgi:hypothetical protein